MVRIVFLLCEMTVVVAVAVVLAVVVAGVVVVVVLSLYIKSKMVDLRRPPISWPTHHQRGIPPERIIGKSALSFISLGDDGMRLK